MKIKPKTLDEKSKINEEKNQQVDLQHFEEVDGTTEK